MKVRLITALSRLTRRAIDDDERAHWEPHRLVDLSLRSQSSCMWCAAGSNHTDTRPATCCPSRICITAFKRGSILPPSFFSRASVFSYRRMDRAAGWSRGHREVCPVSPSSTSTWRRKGGVRASRRRRMLINGNQP